MPKELGVISIRNAQQLIPIDEQKIVNHAAKILELLDYADYDLGILLCDDETMRTYNKKYRNKDNVTDVLSFPYHPALKPGERICPQTPDDKNLGDLIIAPTHVKKDAEALGVTLEKRLQVLLVHGICHLLGYDHIKDEDYEIMKQQEEYLLHELQKFTIQ